MMETYRPRLFRFWDMGAGGEGWVLVAARLRFRWSICARSISFSFRKLHCCLRLFLELDVQIPKTNITDVFTLIFDIDDYLFQSLRQGVRRTVTKRPQDSQQREKSRKAAFRDFGAIVTV